MKRIKRTIGNRNASLYFNELQIHLHQLHVCLYVDILFLFRSKATLIHLKTPMLLIMMVSITFWQIVKIKIVKLIQISQMICPCYIINLQQQSKPFCPMKLTHRFVTEWRVLLILTKSFATYIAGFDVNNVHSILAVIMVYKNRYVKCAECGKTLVLTLEVRSEEFGSCNLKLWIK